MTNRIDMVITDLDGTLLNSDRRVSPANLETLIQLGQHSVPRVIATGRSLFSFHRVLSEDAPIDYLIFSSGAGTVHWPNQSLIHSAVLDAETVEAVSQQLKAEHFDFMIQRPIPDNHAFSFWGEGTNNADFLRRIQCYAGHATPLCRNDKSFGPACQFVIIFPPGDTRWEALLTRFAPLTVIRATSPLDHESTWIEIFPPTVSKSQAAARLCKRLNIDERRTLAIGNDYNDADLLQWAGFAAVVDNAPQDLKERHSAVAHHNDHGFTEAVHQHFQFS